MPTNATINSNNPPAIAPNFPISSQFTPLIILAIKANDVNAPATADIRIITFNITFSVPPASFSNLANNATIPRSTAVKTANIPPIAASASTAGHNFSEGIRVNTTTAPTSISNATAIDCKALAFRFIDNDFKVPWKVFITFSALRITPAVASKISFNPSKGAIIVLIAFPILTKLYTIPAPNRPENTLFQSKSSAERQSSANDFIYSSTFTANSLMPLKNPNIKFCPSLWVSVEGE